MYIGGLSLTAPGSKTRRGRVIKEGKIAPTLDTGCQVGIVEIEDANERDNQKEAARF